MTKTRVGVPSQIFFLWSGGIDLITRLSNALALDPDLEIVVLVASQGPDLNLRVPDGFKAKSGWLTEAKDKLLNILPPKETKDNLAEIKKEFDPKIKFIYYENSLSGFIRCLRNLKIDVVFPSPDPLGKNFPIPWVGYIWDFQHRYYPQYFKDEEILKRNRNFGYMAAEAPSIIVNAESVKKDIAKYFKKGARRTIALPFSPEPNPEWFNIDIQAVAKKYKLPERYFLVSNQFWLHKGHLTAIRAVAKLLKDSKYKDVQLICSGKVHEPRRPEYIDELKAEIKKLGLQQSVRFLGYIPKDDQIGIMRGATAVVQPTEFEGGRGGGAAADAISLGVSIILSDIPVNREISNPYVSFFKTASADSLSKHMKLALNTNNQPTDRRKLISEGKANKLSLSKALRRAIDMALINFVQT